MSEGRKGKGLKQALSNPAALEGRGKDPERRMRCPRSRGAVARAALSRARATPAGRGPERGRYRDAPRAPPARGPGGGTTNAPHFRSGEAAAKALPVPFAPPRCILGAVVRVTAPAQPGPSPRAGGSPFPSAGRARGEGSSFSLSL